MCNRITLALAGFILILISGCDRVTPEARVDLDCGSETDKTFEDWPEWIKVNVNLIEGHGAKWADVYVDDLAKATYLAASAPYPECARIVKLEYSDESATVINTMTVMGKMPPGYDPDNGDWWYGVYDGSGTLAGLTGKLHSECIVCHKKASDADYL